jgi:hypothetical protein
VARTSPLQLVIQAVDKATGPLGRVAAAVRGLGEKAKPLRDKLANLGATANLDGLRDGLRSVASTIGGIVVKVGLLGVAAAAAFGKLVYDSAQAGDELGKFADRAGLTADRAGQLRYALQRIGGASQGDVTNGIKTLTKNLGDLRAGAGGALSEALDKMPGRFRAQVKAAKNVEEVIVLVTKGLQKLKEPTKQAAFASKFFGDELGGRLGPLLAKEGVAGLAKFSAQFARVAGPQKDFTERSAEMSDALDDAKLALTALRDQAVTAVLPDLTKGVKRAGEAIIANKGKIVEAVKGFVDGIKAGLTGLGAALEGLSPSFKGLTGAIDEVLGRNDQASSSAAKGATDWKALGTSIGEATGKGLVGAIDGLRVMLDVMRGLATAVGAVREGFRFMGFVADEVAASLVKAGLQIEGAYLKARIAIKRAQPTLFLPKALRKEREKEIEQLEGEFGANRAVLAAVEENRAKARREQVKGSTFAKRARPKFKDFGPAPRATINGRPLIPEELQSHPEDPEDLVSRDPVSRRPVGPVSVQPVAPIVAKVPPRKLDLNVSFKNIPRDVEVETNSSSLDDVDLEVSRGFSNVSVQ